MEKVRHGLSVDVSSGRGQWRVDVGMSIDPHHAKLPDRRSVAMDGANGQTEIHETKGKLVTHGHANTHMLITNLDIFTRSILIVKEGADAYDRNSDCRTFTATESTTGLLMEMFNRCV